MKKRFASSIDVARLAGVSQSTVSRALRNDPSVAKKSYEKVMAAAKELGYRPSLLPKIMLTQQSRLIALVIGGLHNPYYAHVIQRFTDEFQKLNCGMLLMQVDNNDAIDDMVPMLSGYRVDAVISALPILSDQAAEQLASLRIPVISFNNNLFRPEIHSVGGDGIDAGRRVARHLIDQGASRLAFFGGPENNPANVSRRTGFTDEASRMGQEVQVSHADFTYEGGVTLTKAAFDQPGVPDAVFCANDLIAIGLMDTLRRFPGLTLPSRIRIVGYDDVPQSSWAPYQLSSVRQDTEGIIEHIASVLRSFYQTEEPPLKADILRRGKLITRRSSVSGFTPEWFRFQSGID
jgi:DNA-binding LacI/PurR family transcriptional regulator